MVDEPLDDISPEELNQLADSADQQTRFFNHMKRASKMARTLASSKSAIAGTQARLAECRAQEAAAKSDLAAALVAVENAKASAGVEAERILQSARDAATALAEKARADLATDLATTHDELKAARLELEELNRRIGRVRAALAD
jgi:hypothetical protein